MASSIRNTGETRESRRLAEKLRLTEAGSFEMKGNFNELVKYYQSMVYAFSAVCFLFLKICKCLKIRPGDRR
jgi:hypothetical protein